MAAKFDFSQIPEIECRRLGKTFLAAVERFYANPENIRRFEEWKKEQEARDAAEATRSGTTKTNKREG